LNLPEDDVQLDDQTEIALFRVAQESLTNAAKYARASQVSIALQIADAQVALSIADNGVGITPADLKRTHTHGLLGMRQRVAAHGGHFDIQRGISNGTEIHVVMPCVRAAASSPDAAPVGRSQTPV
jgi:signal transduction histidine kinase